MFLKKIIFLHERIARVVSSLLYDLRFEVYLFNRIINEGLVTWKYVKILET